MKQQNGKVKYVNDIIEISVRDDGAIRSLLWLKRLVEVETKPGVFSDQTLSFSVPFNLP